MRAAPLKVFNDLLYEAARRDIRGARILWAEWVRAQQKRGIFYLSAPWEIRAPWESEPRVVVTFTLPSGARWNWPIEGTAALNALCELLDRANVGYSVTTLQP